MTSKITQVQALTEVDRGGPDAITLRACIDETFTIGPKVHGGTLQMIVAKAARTALTALTPAGDKLAEAAAAMIPVAISSDFLTAPDAADVDFVVSVRKRGRTVTVLSVDAVQQGRTVVSSSVTMARPDSGAPHHSGPTVLDGTPPEPTPTGIPLDGSPISEVNHLGAAIDLVLDSETFPIVRGETGEPLVRGWIRPKGIEPDEYFSVLVCDISPPVVMNLALFGWAPTVQLTTYVRRHPAPGWLRFAATSSEVGPGMFEEDHLVVDSTGTVVAQSRQLALIPSGR
ncbi:thioesterase family protein [Gordonia sp. zg691]|uniref:Thioesterase family protein n=1 Tax=Gordonia jinghuaiqii TaxID=2758710 RepID=A0A7D7RRI6_9ACTN|nr:thioesterase family protein [Gordonia jinghuaiqii]MBD0861860.1 thioesterase family protein [Gordonia jinghuaiqii]MCR5977752.1 thioesterase family protein [Gordonia jinghuaiqii]QMT02413.1 thioesterase family protein [Gordonia jinghuaiqii]